MGGRGQAGQMEVRETLNSQEVEYWKRIRFLRRNGIPETGEIMFEVLCLSNQGGLGMGKGRDAPLSRFWSTIGKVKPNLDFSVEDAFNTLLRDTGRGKDTLGGGYDSRFRLNFGEPAPGLDSDWRPALRVKNEEDVIVTQLQI